MTKYMISTLCSDYGTVRVYATRHHIATLPSTSMTFSPALLLYVWLNYEHIQLSIAYSAISLAFLRDNDNCDRVATCAEPQLYVSEEAPLKWFI